MTSEENRIAAVRRRSPVFRKGGERFWQGVENDVIGGFAFAANVVTVDRDRLKAAWENSINRAVETALVWERWAVAQRLKSRANRRRHGKSPEPTIPA